MDRLNNWRKNGNPPEKPPDPVRTRGNSKESNANWAGMLKTVDRINPIRNSRAVGQKFDHDGSKMHARVTNPDLERIGSDLDPRKEDLDLERQIQAEITLNEDSMDDLVCASEIAPNSTVLCSSEVNSMATSDSMSNFTQINGQLGDKPVEMMNLGAQVDSVMQGEIDELKSGNIDCVYQNPMFHDENGEITGAIPTEMEDVIHTVDDGPIVTNLEDMEAIQPSDDQIHEALIAYVTKSYSNSDFENELRKFITKNILNPEFESKFGDIFCSSSIVQGLRNRKLNLLHAPALTDSVIGKSTEIILNDIRNCTIDEDKDSKPSKGKKFKPGIKEGKNFKPKFFCVTPEGRTIIKLVAAKYKIPDAPLLTPLMSLEFKSGNDHVSSSLDFKGSVKDVKKQKLKLKKQNRESILKPRNELQFCDKGKSILGAIPSVKNMVFKAKGKSDNVEPVVENKKPEEKVAKVSDAGAVKGPNENKEVRKGS
ncbi:hypothetical protein L1987_24186 [Smallanthus sonchifolius]|uniref:Uncharacterized protein n=1 Tax=Smallanthus sonchifolius TaxID=185202 RepID=A0ACB9IJI8_9ASTR|nr:hypothetical protein L1987_24186 [Smallanthus sonchifolius]